MMKTKVYQFNYEGTVYEVPVTYKRQRNLYVRFRNGKFSASAPSLCLERTVIDFINKSLPKLIKRDQKKRPIEPAIGDNYFYLLGDKIEGNVNDKELRKFALKTFTELTRNFEKIMGIKKPYNVRVRKMNTRFGSNSSYTHTITYSLDLIHFSKDIISSVVIHELCHDSYRNHQKGFYNCLTKYCPEYKIYRNKLLKREYK